MEWFINYCGDRENLICDSKADEIIRVMWDLKLSNVESILHRIGETVLDRKKSWSNDLTVKELKWILLLIY